MNIRISVETTPTAAARRLRGLWDFMIGAPPHLAAPLITQGEAISYWTGTYKTWLRMMVFSKKPECLADQSEL